jgi:hypothetical protein
LLELHRLKQDRIEACCSETGSQPKVEAMSIDVDSEIRGEIERIRQIYCCDVLKKKHRELQLLGRKCSPQILYTFLGYELKMGRKRVSCPDISSARYLKLFAEIGMHSARMPYDPTHTALVLTGLEHSLHEIHRLLLTKDLTPVQHRRALRRTYAKIRAICQCRPVSGDETEELT